MPSVIITADVVGSTEAKSLYGEAHGIVMIRAALESFREWMIRVDPNLICPTPPAGDNIVLIGGTDPVEVYHGALRYQADFVAVPYNRLPVKITIGYGSVEPSKDKQGIVGYHSRDLDLIYRVNDFCPAGGVQVTASIFSILSERGFGTRFHRVTENLAGFGRREFYESNGEFRPAKGKRQRYVDRQMSRFLPQTEVGRSLVMMVLWMLALTISVIGNL